MQATTVTNKDGTFSPAIRIIHDDNRIEYHVLEHQTFKDEDEAIKPAQRAMAQLDQSLRRLLRANNYTLREDSKGKK